MGSLATQRCKNHVDREAVARCMSCMDYFCRECTTEHDGRMICKHCLEEELTQQQQRPKRHLVRGFIGGIAALGSFTVCFFIFYKMGSMLISIAESYYERLW
ncbi:hypothetical protein [Ruficoccus sp. ZRK36]|uniref:hypothetical protein n=1 Tax=Ruficoccus sp. ZRK36 TaxID=2866311 RepID=UPI001C72B4E7|nr:hypothetical protein [Ruficoccus sp. ZRK36]QYY35097.1 hypothetical protein K0V07_12400 [Ruficoccus sp. ZRK36]